MREHGYPRRLRGGEIPLVGRIAAIADVFDALTSDRPYRDALGDEEAREAMRRERGSHFDPGLLDVFLGLELSALAVGEWGCGPQGELVPLRMQPVRPAA